MAFSPDVLFNALAADLGLDGLDPFDPFPHGLPSEMEIDSALTFAKLSLLRSLLKKFENKEGTQEDQDANRVALQKFKQANEACRTYEYDPWPDDPAVGYSLHYSRLMLKEWFEPGFGAAPRLVWPTVSKDAQFGPGASCGLQGPTSLYFKIGSAPITATSDALLSRYIDDMTWNPTCHFAEAARMEAYGSRIISTGRLSFQPKSRKESRTILVGPSVNTYYQLGAGKVIEVVLRKETGIDLTVQPSRNAELARVGSVDGSFATIDLTSCSDYQSLTMIRAHCPKSVVRFVEELRVPTYVYKPNDGSIAEEGDLYMASTMGDGITFPLQTAILTSVVLGVYKTLDIPVVRPSLVEVGNFGVFGDDIVCLKQAYGLVMRVLSSLGYLPNEGKSFGTGKFRESCGSDWYEGVNVRGVYIKSLDTKQEIASAFNRLILWAARWGIQINGALSVLYQELGDAPLVPPDEPINSGLMCPISPKPVKGVFPYEIWKPKARLVDMNPEHGVHSSRWIASLKDVVHSDFLNEWAILKVGLAGGIRRGVISLRNGGLRYVKRSAVTPRWGYSDQGVAPQPGSTEYDRWKRFFYAVVDRV